MDPAPAREITAGKPVDVEKEEGPVGEIFNAFYNFSSTEIILVETMETLDTKALLLNVRLNHDKVNYPNSDSCNTNEIFIKNL